MGTYLNKPPPVHAYYDPDGSLVTFTHPRTHNAKKELVFVSTYDAKRFNPDDVCYVISSSWHSTWIDYVSKNTTKWPGEIDNMSLLSNPIERIIRSDLKFKKHYRAINRAVWEFYFRSYGGGPVLFFKVPAGYAEHEYTQSTWIKRIKLHEISTVIMPSSDPQLVNNLALTDNPMAMTNATLAVNLLTNNLARQKIQQAAELQQQVGVSQAETLSLQLARDQQKAKLAAEDQHLAEQQTKSNAALAASLFGGNLSSKLQNQALETEKEQTLATTQSAIALFADANAKKNFKLALEVKDMEKARYYAACMLKNCWKGKVARRRAMELKLKKRQLLLEAMARKVQSSYRCRLARRKTEQLKRERQRVREELAATIVQSRYRIKRAQRKATRLRLERQRLLEESAALRLQSRWRIKQANSKMKQLRRQRDIQAGIKSRAMLKICGLFLLFFARRKLRALQREQQYVVVVGVKGARNINIGDHSSSDPYVMLTLLSSSSSPNHNPNPYSHSNSMSRTNSTASTTNTTTNNTSSSSGNNTSKPFPLLNKAGSVLLKSTSSSHNLNEQLDGLVATGPTLSQYRTKHLNGTLNPTWNETAILTRLTLSPADNSKIVLTVMDKDTFHKDKFLGQVVIAMDRLNMLQREDLLKGKTLSFTDTSIDSLKEHIHDVHGRVITFPKADMPGRGVIDFDIKLMPPQHSHCGWVMKLASTQMVVSFGGQTFKPRFMLLMNGQLSYYDNEMSLEQPRDTIRCSDVGLLQYGPDNKSGVNTLHICTKDGSSEWFLHWLSSESEVIIGHWLRKIEMACHPLTINNEPSMFALSSLTAGGNRMYSVNSTTSNPIVLSKTGGGGGAGKAMRRVSSLMGGMKK